MGIEEIVLHKLKKMPLKKKHEVLDFVESIQEKPNAKQPRRNLKGLWSELNINITEEDIAEARQEMWSNFPREIKK